MTKKKKSLLDEGGVTICPILKWKEEQKTPFNEETSQLFSIYFYICIFPQCCFIIFLVIHNLYEEDIEQKHYKITDNELKVQQV